MTLIANTVTGWKMYQDKNGNISYFTPRSKVREYVGRWSRPEALNLLRELARTHISVPGRVSGDLFYRTAQHLGWEVPDDLTRAEKNILSVWFDQHQQSYKAPMPPGFRVVRGRITRV